MGGPLFRPPPPKVACCSCIWRVLHLLCVLRLRCTIASSHHGMPACAPLCARLPASVHICLCRANGSDWGVLRGGSLNTSYLDVIDQAYVRGPTVVMGSLGHCSASFSTLRAGDETNLTLTIAPSARNSFRPDLVLVFSTARMVLRAGIRAAVVSDTHEQSDLAVDVVMPSDILPLQDAQGALRLSLLPPSSAPHNVSIRVRGLQNAALSGPSGPFSLVLLLDEERRIDMCELPSTDFWAPPQDPLSPLACPPSFYSHVELKLGIYTPRCLACPPVLPLLPLPSPCACASVR